ncbi:hypothetical protein S7711_02722 [Stachybotrys chartarum IBT 7711]|uniref:Uncharacterized protein n=1 Tax=Stachybotrys chartarum (strain CBS 109288 / IBT 7711) TaxID=1280523 RepID=A0A084AZ40_STACB|nr:hypothetical protein S7711_02722 [Stachybotrys chartarum IBT 7711]
MDEPRLLHRSLLHRPHEVVSARGAYLTLSSGARILDACAGAAVAVIGHGNPEVQAAVAEQMSRVSYVHTMAYTTSSAEQLADALLAGKPFGLSKAYLVGSGSEATDSALKLARQYFVEKGDAARTQFVARRQAYHGNTVGAMSVSSNLARKAPYHGALLLDNVSFVSPAYDYRGRNQDETEEAYAARLVRELDDEFRRVGPGTVIAFIAETVGGATAGCITPPRGYLAGVRRVCDDHGVLLILDEVMCGSGRTGSYFAFEPEGDVRPDLVTLGKGLGGGYAPIAAVLAHERVVEVLRRGTASFNHGHTYQAHPVGCAAALAVHRIIARDGLVAAAGARGAWLGAELRRALAAAKYVGNVRGRGLFWAVEFVADRATRRPFAPGSRPFGVAVQERAFALGVALYPGRGTADGVAGDHVIVAPPLNVTEEELRVVVGVLAEAYRHVEREVDGDAVDGGLE